MMEVTHLLDAIEQGDRCAARQLLQAVYDDLRRLAAAKLADEPAGQTLDPTDLVHEAYLRLVGTLEGQVWNGRGHFFAAAAEAMRRILVENARRKRRQRHGGGRQRIDLNKVGALIRPPSDDLLALNDALNRLAERDPVRAELVKLRFFAGLTMSEAARALGISRATAERYWTFARTWLYADLTEANEGPDDKKKPSPV
jgi:RNA polymerase sigma factor (TIGR02999 family)